MGEIENGRVTAELEGDFVVFRIGMRIDTLWQVHEWFPVFREMPGTFDELESDPDSGLLGDDTNVGLRNHEVVQSWRSSEALREYALGPDSRHAPAMEWVNERAERMARLPEAA
jgi:hypothetical protein